MKKSHFSALACFVLSAIFLPAAFGNHRTGSLPLPEILVAGDFNGTVILTWRSMWMDLTTLPSWRVTVWAESL